MSDARRSQATQSPVPRYVASERWANGKTRQTHGTGADMLEALQVARNARRELTIKGDDGETYGATWKEGGRWRWFYDPVLEGATLDALTNKLAAAERNGATMMASVLAGKIRRASRKARAGG